MPSSPIPPPCAAVLKTLVHGSSTFSISMPAPTGSWPRSPAHDLGLDHSLERGAAPLAGLCHLAVGRPSRLAVAAADRTGVCALFGGHFAVGLVGTPARAWIRGGPRLFARSARTGDIALADRTLAKGPPRGDQTGLDAMGGGGTRRSSRPFGAVLGRVAEPDRRHVLPPGRDQVGSRARDGPAPGGVLLVARARARPQQWLLAPGARAGFQPGGRRPRDGLAGDER